LSGHSISINECTLQQLSEYSAYEPERLGDTFIGTPFCSLEQCLQVIASHPQTTLYIEIKSESINHYGRQCVLDSLLPLIFPHQQQCVLISFDFTILEQAVSAGWLRTGPVLSQWQQRAGLPAGEAGIEIIFCDYNDLPSELTSDDLAYPIAVYEVGNKELASQLLKRGISMIETFAIGDLISCAT
jgi:glycerophosphoryl diester phosphodiesterase